MKRYLLMTLLTMSPFCLFAGLSGKYHFSGFDPYDCARYEGTVVIKRNELVCACKKNKQESSYTALWSYNDGFKERGTGVRNGDHIAFVYGDVGADQEGKGVILYHIVNDNELTGSWVPLGRKKVGHEKLERVTQNNNQSALYPNY